MKKSLIAIAALAAVGAASAQSSVTMYGLADVFVGQKKQTDVTHTTAGEKKVVTKSTGFNSGGLQGSRLGVKGVEDLGNGLKAVFNYELGFNAINGDFDDDGGFNRRAVVGLQGNFGSVLAGTDYTPLFNLLNASTADALSSFDTTNLKTDRAAGVHYSGNFSGVGVQAFYGYQKDATTTTRAGTVIDETGMKKGTGYGLGVSYANGPFMVGLAAQEFKNNQSNAITGVTGQKKTTEAGVGASYDFGAAKLFANYVQARQRDTENGVFAGKEKAEEANIGVKVPFGAASLVAEYGHNRWKGYNADGTVGKKAKGNDWLIGANYAFSKRTDVYVRAGRNNDFKFKYKTANDVATRSKKTENYAVGLRHKF